MRTALAALFILAASLALAEDQTAKKPAPAPAQQGVIVQFVDSPLSDVMMFYADLKQVRVIRDATADDVMVTMSAESEMSKAEAIQFIEKGLLLNGCSLVPAGKGMVKLVISNPTSNPSPKVSRRRQLIAPPPP